MPTARILRTPKTPFEEINKVNDLMQMMQKLPMGKFLPKDEAYEKIGCRTYFSYSTSKEPKTQKQELQQCHPV